MRSITARNLAGGLWGGVLGILALGHIHPWLLPVGCLFGVVVGWWYQEIGIAVVTRVRDDIKKVKDGWQTFIQFVSPPWPKMALSDMRPILRMTTS